MNIFLYMFIGWFIGEFFHLTIWELIKKKYNLDFSKLKTIFIFISIAILLSIVFSGLYRVQTNHAVVLTKMGGAKQIVTNTGIKYSLFSQRQDITLQKQMLRFPFFAPDDGFSVVTSDEKPLLVSSYLEYKITDPYKWAIENKNTEKRLESILSTYTIQAIQKNNYSFLREHIMEISNQTKEEMKSIESEYGIKITGFNIRILDTSEVRGAKSSAEAEKIKANALKKSYESEAEALRIKYNALPDKNFIMYMEMIKAIEDGKINNVVLGNDIMKTFNIS